MKILAAIVCALLGLFVAGEYWLWAPETPRVAADSNGSGEVPGDVGVAPEEFRLRALDTFSGVWERPLFVQGRRPPPPEEAEAAAPTAPEPPPMPKEPLHMEISAILAIGQDKTVMLRNPPKDSPSRLKVGDEFQGWQVERIEADLVVMSRGDEREEVPLRKFESTSVAPSAEGDDAPPSVRGERPPTLRGVERQRALPRIPSRLPPTSRAVRGGGAGSLAGPREIDTDEEDSNEGEPRPRGARSAQRPSRGSTNGTLPQPRN